MAYDTSLPLPTYPNPNRTILLVGGPRDGERLTLPDSDPIEYSSIIRTETRFPNRKSNAPISMVCDYNLVRISGQEYEFPLYVFEGFPYDTADQLLALILEGYQARPH